MENRSYWLDYAKAIGIILVVYGHIARGLFQAGLFPQQEIYQYLDSIIYSFHMPLFFFLSGSLFYSSFIKRGGNELLWSKVDTVVYPYLLWSLLQGGIEVLLSSQTNGDAKVGDVLNLLWEPRAQFWFLYALFLLFVVVSTVFAISGRGALWPLFLAAVGLYFWETPLLNFPPYRLIASNLVFFMFGVAFSLTTASRFTTGLAWLPWAIVFIAAQYLFHETLALTYRNRGLYALLLALVSIMLVVSISRYAAKKPNKMILLIGASSMAIYLMHILIGSGTRILLQKVLGFDSLMGHLLAGCSLGLLLPMIVYAMRDRMHIKYLFFAPIANTLRKWLTMISAPSRN